MKDLVLTGFMGVGKTTVGRCVADRYALRFVDLDQEIVRRAGKPIADIFREEGEDAFRAIERDTFAALLSSGEGRVIATGGGTLLTDESVSLLSDGQTVITLTCPLDLALRRATAAGGRPLLESRGREDLEALHASRQAAYRRFPQVDTSDGHDAVSEIGRVAGLERAASYTVDRSIESRVLVERGALAHLAQILEEVAPGAQLLLVSDRTVRSLPSVDAAIAALREAWQVAEAVIPPGEEHKTTATVESVYRACLDARLDRSAVVVGIGGGVIGDLSGLVAATYLRGLRLVLVPTTLLAQVDASIGGKVGVDFQGVKNMVGAFHPAETVAIDPDALATLPDALLSDGLAEVVKIGFVRDLELLEWCESLPSARAVVQDAAIVRRAASDKVRVVREDPYERGVRALLNFGHTIGHAIETAADFRLSHGSCVAIGMVAETRLAELHGWCPPGTETRLQSLLEHFNLPVFAPGIDVDAAYAVMLQDKKRANGAVRVAVPERLGTGTVKRLTPADARSALEYAMGMDR